MTACVNKRRALAAALAGVLALGGAALAVTPGVALAAGASAQFASKTEYANGTMTGLSFKDDNSATYTLGADNEIQLNSTSAFPITVGASSGAYVTPAGSSKQVGLSANFRMRVYACDKDGEITGSSLSGNKIFHVGYYAVVVEGLTGSDYAGQTYKQVFEVKAAALPKTVQAWESIDESDGDFYFTGSELTVDHFTYTNASRATVQLVEGTDYTVAYALNNGTVTAFKNAGTYTATVTGKGIYEGQTATSSIVVKPFVLCNADITVSPFTGSFPTTPTRVYDAATKTALDPSLVVLTPYDRGTTGGSYEVTIDANGAIATWVSGSASNVTVIDGGTVSADGAYVLDADVNGSLKATGNVVYGTLVTSYGNSKCPQAVAYKVDSDVSFKYGDAALASSYEVVTANKESFDTTKITGVYGKSGVIANSALTITVDKKEAVSSGSSAAADLAAGVAGTYTVTVTALDGSGYTYGGSQTVTVKVWKGAVDADATLYVYDRNPSDGTDSGVAITSKTVLYNGSGYDTTMFRVDGKDSAGNDIDGWNDGNTTSDIDVKIVDADGNVVGSAVDAGSYKLVVTSDVYKLSGTTELPITIEKVDLTSLSSGKVVTWNKIAGMEILPLTNKGYDGVTYADYNVSTASMAISKAYGLDLRVNGETLKGKTLPDNVDIVVQYDDNGTWKDVTTIEYFDATTGKVLFAEGDYRVVVTVAEDVAKNYVLPESGEAVLELDAEYQGTYSDVQPDAWYFSYVEEAKFKGYMNGYGNTGTFGPEATLTRAQAVQVLYNMSGVNYKGSETDTSFSTTGGYKTGFADVDSNGDYLWASQAIAWAKSLGIVSGYGDTNNFGPGDAVTREQFAKMLALYAQKVNGTDISSDGTALAKKSDASSVDSWAVDYVEWCCDEGIFSVDQVRPTDTISRAEVAKMVVVYQTSRNGHVGGYIN